MLPSVIPDEYFYRQDGVVEATFTCPYCRKKHKIIMAASRTKAFFEEEMHKHFWCTNIGILEKEMLIKAKPNVLDRIIEGLGN